MNSTSHNNNEMAERGDRPSEKKKNKQQLRKTIDVFSLELWSIAAAAASSDAMGVYAWSISRKARNAAVHSVNGNVRRSKKMPDCVRRLRGHDRARAALCAGCDRYISGAMWRNMTRTGVVSLLERVEQLKKVRECIPLFRLSNRALGTSVCTSCIAMFTKRKRGLDKPLHTAAHALAVKKRRQQCVFGPPCEREEGKEADCDICSRVSKFSRKAGPRSPPKRKAGDALVGEKRKRGRPSKSGHAPASSLTHNSGRGGGRPVSVGEKPYEETKHTQYDVAHQLLDDVACAATSSTSNAARERMHGVLRRSSLSVQPNMQAAMRERSHCFDNWFQSSRLDLGNSSVTQYIQGSEKKTAPSQTGSF